MRDRPGRWIGFAARLASLLAWLPLASVAAAPAGPAASPAPLSIHPSRLEVNLGPLPVDIYNDAAVNNGAIPSCSATRSVRQCIRAILSNYAKQKVTGVRFNFALGGGYVDSTAFDAKGNVRDVWITNLYQFFLDLKSVGITKMTPSSALGPDWSGTLRARTVADQAGMGCAKGSRQLLFYPWLPFGLDPTSHLPDGAFDNASYACSPRNPLFWGWQPYFNLVASVASAAQAAGITIEEFDIENEIDLWAFTVQARLLYDNTTSPPTPVLQTVDRILAYFGVAPGSATYSVAAGFPSSAGNACLSIYGDAAYLATASQLVAAINGGRFGSPPYFTLDGLLPCDASSAHCGSLTSGTPGYNPHWVDCATAGMITIPPQPQPHILDVHVYPCVSSGGPCKTTLDVTGAARQAYNAVWTFLRRNGLTDSVAMIGETASDAPTTLCDGLTPVMARQNVNGYVSSTLHAADAAKTVLRPWSQMIVAYCPPVVIGAPSGLYAP